MCLRHGTAGEGRQLGGEPALRFAQLLELSGIPNKCSGSCGRSHNCRSGRMGGCVMPPHRSMRHRHALTFPSDRRPLRVSARVHTEGESHPHQSHSGRQTERGRPGRPQMRVRPRKPLHRRRGAVPARALQKGGSIPFPRTHRGSGKTPPERPSKGRSKGGKNRQGKHQARRKSLGGASPTFSWMQDIPERLRLRLGWTPRPVPGSSKPSLILLYAGKDDAGALDAYLHAYNPAFSEYIWAVDIRRKGGDLGQDMLGEEPYSTMCSMAMAGKVALDRVAHRR